MNLSWKHNYAWIAILALYAGFIVWVMTGSTGILETGDGISHFQISKNSWESPELFLHHWGKPLFTLFSSPFAQFGFDGLIVFNLVCTCLTALLSVRIVRRMGGEQAWIAVLFFLCAPVYYKVLIGGMTETLFALLLCWVIERLVYKSYVLAVIIASFLFFSRPEAYIVLPFIMLYVFMKKWKAIPWILTGFVIYSIWGYFVLDDAFWLITEDPYMHKEAGVYGSGPFLSFISQSKDITGIPLSLLFVLALVMGILLPENRKSEKGLILWLLLILPATAVLLGHSYLWWKGLNGSLGLKRVMATIIPLVAIVAALGLSSLFQLLGRPKLMVVVYGIIAVACALVLIDRVPLHIAFSDKDATAIEAAKWVREHHAGKKLYSLDPLIPFEAEVNVYDEEQHFQIWSMDKETPSKTMQPGEIMVWESHYSPQEGRMSKEAVFTDEGLELLKSFVPDPPIVIFGNRDYEVHVFKKK